MSPVVVLFWTVMTFMVFGIFIRPSSHSASRLIAFALGLVVGLGFFTGAAWPVVALSIVGAMAVSIRRKGWMDTKALLSMASPLVILAGLFFFLSYTLMSTEHMKSIFVFQAGSDWFHSSKECLLKWATLFWIATPFIDYGPRWGGMLNPVLSSGFFWGILVCVRNYRQGFFQWILFSLLLLSSPGFLAKGHEIFRMVHVFPLLILVSGLGWTSLFLTSDRPNRRKVVGLILLLSVSSALDFYHFEGPYHRLWGTPGPAWNHLKLIQYWNAYEILKKHNEKNGPGMILSDFRPETFDQTLTVAAYSFDATYNRNIPFAEVRWAALLVHPDYKPFLSKIFPTGRWYWLEQDEMLGIVPVDPMNIQTLRSWYEVNQRLKSVTAHTFDMLLEESRIPIIRQILEIESSIKPDAFLMSCLWEKVAFHRVVDKDVQGALIAFQQALKNGFPAAHFYYLQGLLLADIGKFDDARQAFQKAIRCPLNLSSAAEELLKIDGILGSDPKQPHDRK
jgi:hypothetical protein